MEHVVFFPGQDGGPAFRRVAGLEEAVRLVEHLRNVEGVTEASVHALTEVPLAFKAYYKVELPVAPQPAPEAEASRVDDLVPAQAPEPEPEPALSGPSSGSGRSLGFFA